MASNDCSVCVSWASLIPMYISNLRSPGCNNICAVVILYDEHILCLRYVLLGFSLVGFILLGYSQRLLQQSWSKSKSYIYLIRIHYKLPESCLIVVLYNL